MAAAFGVHVGATTASLAVYKDGRTTVVANAGGDRVTPTLVAFESGELVVGLPAKQGIMRNAANTMSKAKQLVGQEFSNSLVQTIVQESSCKIVNKDGAPIYEVDNNGKPKTFTPEDILSAVYRNVKDTAVSHLHTSDSELNVVLTVPIRCSHKRRRLISQAAHKAGFRVLRIINEPTAAALAYGIGQDDPREISNTLVYRIGGSSMDVTIINVNGGIYRVFFFPAVRERSTEHRTRVRPAHSQEEIFQVPSAGDIHNRGRFEGLCTSLLARCIQPADDCLAKAGLERSQIQKVMLVGGSSRIPSLQAQLTKMFPDAAILNSLPGDEVVALGAVMEGSLLTGKDVMLGVDHHDISIDCSCKPIIIKMFCAARQASEVATVIASGTPIPVRRQQTLRLPAGQTAAALHVCEGDEGDATLLAKGVMKGLPEGAAISVALHLKSCGTLHVTFSEKSSGRSHSFTIETIDIMEACEEATLEEESAAES
ncbi:PREDICTED: heat shock 70 kDa protein 14-like [Priapulus caudatus]|uniref:Heat shock 70 kDa protein 14-like n=1 Tax=Priapulus caudatus TaxID=37621 RepID=A0ABM1EF36_PRICU|nr:PREDICTED: heat shock 70 kDa protein 14-like [Priapulus caudatus]